MATSMISKPGTKYGPCKEECEHRDCKELRLIASAVCVKCGEVIGYDSRFSKIIGRGLIHLCCIDG